MMAKRLPPVLLFHGSPATGAVWKDVRTKLSERGFDVQSPTHPAHADPAAPFSGTSVRDLGEQWLSAADIPDEPVRLVGHSFGGAVALRLCLDGLIEIERLIVLEPAALPLLAAAGKTGVFDDARAVFEGYGARHRDGDPDAVETMMRFWFGKGAYEGLPDAVRSYLQSATAVNVRDINACLAETYDPDILAACDIPVTIAYGTASPALTRHLADSAEALLPSVVKRAIEGGTHAMVQTHAAEIAALIAEPA